MTILRLICSLTITYHKRTCVIISLGLLRLSTIYLTRPHNKFPYYFLISLLIGALLIFYKELKNKWDIWEKFQKQAYYLFYLSNISGKPNCSSWWRKALYYSSANLNVKKIISLEQSQFAIPNKIIQARTKRYVKNWQRTVYSHDVKVSFQICCLVKRKLWLHNGRIWLSPPEHNDQPKHH